MRLSFIKFVCKDYTEETNRGKKAYMFLCNIVYIFIWNV